MQFGVYWRGVCPGYFCDGHSLLRPTASRKTAPNSSSAGDKNANLKRRTRGLNVIGLSRNLYCLYSSRSAIQRSNPRVCRSVRSRSAGPQSGLFCDLFKRLVYIESIDRSLSKLYRAFLSQCSFQQANPHVCRSIRARLARPQR